MPHTTGRSAQGKKEHYRRSCKRESRPRGLDQAARELSGHHPINVVDRIDASHGIQYAVQVGHIPHFKHES